MNAVLAFESYPYVRCFILFSLRCTIITKLMENLERPKALSRTRIWMKSRLMSCIYTWLCQKLRCKIEKNVKWWQEKDCFFFFGLTQKQKRSYRNRLILFASAKWESMLLLLSRVLLNLLIKHTAACGEKLMIFMSSILIHFCAHLPSRVSRHTECFQHVFKVREIIWKFSPSACAIFFLGRNILTKECIN